MNTVTANNIGQNKTTWKVVEDFLLGRPEYTYLFQAFLPTYWFWRATTAPETARTQNGKISSKPFFLAGGILMTATFAVVPVGIAKVVDEARLPHRIEAQIPNFDTTTGWQNGAIKVKTIKDQSPWFGIEGSKLAILRDWTQKDEKSGKIYNCRAIYTGPLEQGILDDPSNFKFDPARPIDEQAKLNRTYCKPAQIDR